MVNAVIPTSNPGVERFLPEKEFKLRNSLLTDLLEEKNIKSVYNLFVAAILGLFLTCHFRHYVQHGHFDFGWRIVRFAFGQFHIAILLWLFIFAITCLSYYIFVCWAFFRFKLSKSLRKIWDIIAIILLISYIVLTIILGILTIYFIRLPPGSAAVITLETLRLLVKTYAFIRSNVSIVFDTYQTTKKVKITKFKTYLYYLFAPTLVFSSNYPRTESIRTKYVFIKTIEILSVLLFYCVIVENFFLASYSDFGLRKYPISEIILTLFENAFAGGLIILTSFYMILHCWLNLFAELMRFGDRLFYEDWWNCTTPLGFFTKWNLVVNNFLYHYLYKDIYEHVPFVSKRTTIFLCYVGSALTHEVAIWVALQFCLPILIFLYGLCGVAISFFGWCTRVRVPICLYLYAIFWGTGLVFSTYGMELAARLNKPRNESLIDIFIPRIYDFNEVFEWS